MGDGPVGAAGQACYTGVYGLATRMSRNYLALTAIGADSTSILENMHGTLAELGCNVESVRMLAQFGIQGVLLMLGGSWDAIAKLEDQLPRIGERLDLTLQTRRIDPNAASAEGLPYTIEVVAADRPGIVHEVLGFIRANRMHIRELYSNSPAGQQVGTRVFTLHAGVNVPADVPIAALRGDFMEFCERLNLDAFIEPFKHG